jgi:tricorn protease-like protein
MGWINIALSGCTPGKIVQSAHQQNTFKFIEKASFIPDEGILVIYNNHTSKRIKTDENCYDLKISPDKKTIGWLSEKDFFDESVDGGKFFASKLTIFHSEKLKVLSELPLTGPWKFLKNGKQIACYSSPLHFSENYFLYDIDTDNIVESYDARYEKNKKYPAWTKGIIPEHIRENLNPEELP